MFCPFGYVVDMVTASAWKTVQRALQRLPPDQRPHEHTSFRLLLYCTRCFSPLLPGPPLPLVTIVCFSSRCCSFPSAAALCPLWAAIPLVKMEARRPEKWDATRHTSPSNPVVFLEFSIAGQPVGRAFFELFADRVYVLRCCLESVRSRNSSSPRPIILERFVRLCCTHILACI